MELAARLETPVTFRLSHCPAPASARDAELELVNRVRSGEVKAFGEIVEKYQSMVLRLIYGILHSRPDAEEIAQEVFTKVCFSIQKFEGRSSLFSWIYRIAVNESYAFLRKKRPKLILESHSSDPTLDLRAFPDWQPNPEELAAQKELVNKLLMRMPEDDRVLLLLREVEGLPVSEVARVMGMNQNTVKARMYRARRRLIQAALRLSKPRRSSAVPHPH